MLSEARHETSPVRSHSGEAPEAPNPQRQKAGGAVRGWGKGQGVCLMGTGVPFLSGKMRKVLEADGGDVCTIT